MKELNNVNETKKSWFDGVKGIAKKGADKVKDTAQWIKDNPEEALEKGAVAIEAAFVAALGIATVASASKAKRTVYSEDIGECVELKKPLSNDDKVALDNLMADENLTKIQALQKMNKVK